MSTSVELFESHRRLLISVAYRLLGSVADAEDIVQDVWLDWSKTDQVKVDQPRAYLIRMTTNAALNRMRSARTRRETYVGSWLPEPILTSPDIAEKAETAESVSMAMLVVLETLTPDERAVFVLREVFGYPHSEIAATLDRSEASVRQLAHRARSHVQARRPRFDTDHDRQKQATERFLSAAVGGDLNSLMEVLAPDVTLWSDGGGKVKAPLRDIHGRQKVARFMLAVGNQPWQGVSHEDIEFTATDINGGFGIVIHTRGRPLATVTTQVTGGRITDIQVVANPDKLNGVRPGHELLRLAASAGDCEDGVVVTDLKEVPAAERDSQSHCCRNL